MIFHKRAACIASAPYTALPGNKGFTTKERAQKVAEFVVKKIRKTLCLPQ